MENCIVFPRLWFYEVRTVHMTAKDCLFLEGVHCYRWERPAPETEFENCVICGRCDVWNGMRFHQCTITSVCTTNEGPRAIVTDSILPAVNAVHRSGMVEFCNVYNDDPAKSGKGCFRGPRLSRSEEPGLPIGRKQSLPRPPGTAVKSAAVTHRR